MFLVGKMIDGIWKILWRRPTTDYRRRTTVAVSTILKFAAAGKPSKVFDRVKIVQILPAGSGPWSVVSKKKRPPFSERLASS